MNRPLLKVFSLATLLLLFCSPAGFAAPFFTISGGQFETIGDAGGTNFNNPNGSIAGKGIPTSNGLWPIAGALFGPDASFGNALGTTGYKPVAGSDLTLSLNEAAQVTFTFYGRGDAGFANRFLVNSGSGYQTLFTGGTTGQGTSFTFNLGSGVVPFEFITGNNVTLNNGLNVDVTSSPGFFLGVDPYLATSLNQRTGTSVFIGLTDLPGTGDHDFQDLVVRLQVNPVPEPATMTLFALGAIVVGGYRLRYHKPIV